MLGAVLYSWEKPGDSQFGISEQRQTSHAGAARAVSVAHPLSLCIRLVGLNDTGQMQAIWTPVILYVSSHLQHDLG